MKKNILFGILLLGIAATPGLPAAAGAHGKTASPPQTSGIASTFRNLSHRCDQGDRNACGKLRIFCSNMSRQVEKYRDIERSSLRMAQNASGINAAGLRRQASQAAQMANEIENLIYYYCP